MALINTKDKCQTAVFCPSSAFYYALLCLPLCLIFACYCHWVVSLYHSVLFNGCGMTRISRETGCWCSSGCSGLVVEYQTHNRRVAGLTHTQSTASNLEQVAKLLCTQANSVSYPQWVRKWVVATHTGWRPSVADWGDGVSASCTVGPIVH